MMKQGSSSGLGRVILVWLVGLALGIGAGALTARLLIPHSPAAAPGAPAAEPAAPGDVARPAR